MAAQPPGASSATGLTHTQGIVGALVVIHILGLFYWLLALSRQTTAKKRD